MNSTVKNYREALMSDQTHIGYVGHSTMPLWISWPSCIRSMILALSRSKTNNTLVMWRDTVAMDQQEFDPRQRPKNVGQYFYCMWKIDFTFYQNILTSLSSRFFLDYLWRMIGNLPTNQWKWAMYWWGQDSSWIPIKNVNVHWLRYITHHSSMGILVVTLQ